MPVTLDQFTKYNAYTEVAGDDIHVQAGDGPGAYHWYVNADAAREDETLFDKRAARRFFGQTCGMNEETRDYVVDQIDFEVHTRKPARKARRDGEGETPPEKPAPGEPAPGETPAE